MEEERYNFTILLFYAGRESLQYAWDGRLGEPQSWRSACG
jgi:hypothetical protein